MKQKLRLLVFSLLLLSLGFVFGMRFAGHQHPIPFRGNVVERLQERLNLTPEQIRLVEPALRDTSEKLHAIHEAAVRDSRKEIEAMHEKLRKHLTPEQLEKLESHQHERRSGRHGGPTEPSK